VEAPIPAGSSLLDIIDEDVPSIVTDAIGPYLVSAQLLGQRTAELHLTLASAVDEPNFVPEHFSVTYQRSLSHGMRSFAIQVLQLLRRRLRYLPDEAKADAQTVLSLEDDIIEHFEEIPRRRITGMRIRCHGDYHLGQVLYTGNDFVIIDFEGEPARRLGERRIKRSPLRDVAGMIRSFHYAAYAALRGQASTIPRPEDLPVLREWARSWYLWVSATFLKSYLELLADSPILPQSREGVKTILDSYLLDKAIYEINYELNNRPDWVGLPLQGILQVLQTRDESTRAEVDKEVEKESAEIEKQPREKAKDAGGGAKKKAEK
jgi:maltose alpha-D-glucosyltransferase/alpha-amylase